MQRYKVLMQWTVTRYQPMPGQAQTTPGLTETLIVEAANPEEAADMALSQESEALAQDVLGLSEDVSLALTVEEVELLEAA
jgi:hypothetical protein